MKKEAPTLIGCEWLHELLTYTPDFPKTGICFVSYEKLLKHPPSFKRVIEEFSKRYRNIPFDAVIGLDSRGFIFGSAIAYELHKPYVMIRKAGKLPNKVESVDYELEYGKNAFEIAVDSLHPGDKTLIVDDILATGGTVAAAAQLIERLGAHVHEVACLIELPDLKGRQKVSAPCFALAAIENL